MTFPCEYQPYDPAPGHEPAWRQEDASALYVFQIGPNRFVEVDPREGTKTTTHADSAYLAKHAPAKWWDARHRELAALDQQMWFVQFCKDHGALPHEGVYVAHLWSEIPLLITRRTSIYGYWSLVAIDPSTGECVWSLPLGVREENLEGYGFDMPSEQAEVIQLHQRASVPPSPDAPTPAAA